MALSSVRNNSQYPTLPPELFRPIFAHLDGHRPTLLALCLCNSHLREDAERELYASLDESTSANKALHIAFLTTITQNRRLASYVREYHSDSIVRYQPAPLWDLSYQALRYMSGLKVLHFRVWGGQPAISLLLDVPFRLERLHWGSHSEENGTMVTVLQQQQQLKYLNLQSREGTTFPLLCCPSLRELSGNRDTLEALLPGRHVEEVDWVPDLDDDTESGNLRQIGTELGHLKRLAFGGYFARPHLGLIVDYLKQLEKLEIIGLISDELMLLKHIKSLRELVLSFQWGSRYLPIPQETDERQRLVEDLFSGCQNLLCVDIAYESTTNTAISYQRWTRETAQSTPIMVLIMGAQDERFGGSENQSASGI